MFLSRAIGAGPPPSDDFWYVTPPAGRGALGVSVSTDTAMRLSTVYKCVRIRSETVGMLPLMVYRRLDNGGKEPDTEHPLYALLHDQPNPWQTAMQWRSMMQAHLDLRGNAYTEIVYDGAGRVEMLLPMHPDRTRVEMTPSGAPRYRHRGADGTERVLVWGQVLHVTGLSMDGIVGLNPIELERESIAAAIASRDYGARYFANSARPPLWIKMPGKFSSAEARRDWVNQFQAAYGGGNAGRTPVMEAGMELLALPVNNTDAQYIEQRKMADIDIAGLFRVPQHKLGILDRATWGNIEHQQLDFVTDAILPSCVSWEQALLRDLDFGEDHFAEFKLDMLLRGDTRTRYEAYGKAIQDGWMTRNEARRLENMNPIDGLDDPLEPLNMAPAGSRRAAQERGEPPEGQRAAQERGEPPEGQRAAQEHGAPPDRQRVDRATLIAAAAAERVARKEFAALSRAWRAEPRMPALQVALRGHAEFVAGVMAVPMQAAQAYVDRLMERLQGRVADGSLSTQTESDHIDVQTADLLRLEP